jgi:outer membrane receptor protein involved in Fe transport
MTEGGGVKGMTGVSPRYNAVRSANGRRFSAHSSISILALIVGGILHCQQAAAETAEASPQQIHPVDVSAPRARPARVQMRRQPRRQQMHRTALPSPVVQQVATQSGRPAGTGELPPPKAASEMTFTGKEIADRPATRPAEALEVTPGLIITQHSGEGKANQYFLRGYNLDHGTDLAITLDGMPVNMRTHGHGQGYADLNFLIPELIGTVDVRKGPYFADEGDFSSVGALHVNLIDRLDK